MSDNNLQVEEEEIESPTENFVAALQEIKERCRASDIKFQQKEIEGTTYGTISINSGREKRKIIVSSFESAKKILSIEFENFVYISGFEAICSYSRGIIEATIQAVSIPTSLAERRLFGGDAEGESSGREITISPPDADPAKPTIRIGRPSTESRTLLRESSFRRFSIKLENLSIRTNEQAHQVLTKYANSIFFQIEAKSNVSLMLDRERKRNLVAKPLRRRPERIVLDYPRSAYDEAAIALYWYGRSARGMPLLQFLALYQVIEFYYPRFSNLEARRKLSAILKDPAFNSHRDEHIDRLISAISFSRNGAIGDEKSQLRSVINHCVDPNELRAFLEADAERELHTSGRGGGARFHKIPIQNKSVDIRNDTADRIYDIRCRIVHTKNDTRGGTSEMILPFSTDAELLTHDIDLMQYISRSVLIYTSSTL